MEGGPCWTWQSKFGVSMNSVVGLPRGSSCFSTAKGEGDATVAKPGRAGSFSVRRALAKIAYVAVLGALAAKAGTFGVGPAMGIGLEGRGSLNTGTAEVQDINAQPKRKTLTKCMGIENAFLVELVLKRK